jgi:hypothetical protein
VEGAFDRFAEFRQQAGVRRHRIQRPVDDGRHVFIDLDFDNRDDAARFLDVLQAKVWSSRENAPALAGTPLTRILEPVEDQ